MKEVKPCGAGGTEENQTDSQTEETRLDRLLRDADDLADRFEDEFGGTFLDPVISMIRQLVKEIQILDQAQA